MLEVLGNETHLTALASGRLHSEDKFLGRSKMRNVKYLLTHTFLSRIMPVKRTALIEGLEIDRRYEMYYCEAVTSLRLYRIIQLFVVYQYRQ